MAERFPNLKKAMDEGRVPNPDSLPDPTKRDLRCLPPDHPDRLAEVAGEQVERWTERDIRNAQRSAWYWFSSGVLLGIALGFLIGWLA